MLIVELNQYLGNLENDNGKTYIFNVIDSEKEYTFECILYIREDIDPILTIHKDDKQAYKEQEILEIILNKYSKETLLKNED